MIMAVVDKEPWYKYVGGVVLFDPPCVTKKNMILELSGLTTVLVYFFPGKKKFLYIV